MKEKSQQGQQIHIMTEVLLAVTKIVLKGIAPEHLNKIFDPFFTTKPVGKGTGLGLSLSYSIAEKHSGELSVRSTVGKGTTFRLTLPIRQDEPKAES